MQLMKLIFVLLMSVLFGSPVLAQSPQNGTSGSDDSNIRPPITKVDLQIVRRARKILSSPSKWNRADTRECTSGDKAFSLYCALMKATEQLGAKAEHRSAAMQETRFVIDEITANSRNYEHRLMGYNNDPSTKFSDIQKVLRLVEVRISNRLKVE